MAFSLPERVKLANGFTLEFLEELSWRKSALACYRELKRHIPFTQMLFTSLDVTQDMLTPWSIIEDDSVIPLYVSKEVDQTGTDGISIVYSSGGVDIFLENDIEHSAISGLRRDVYLKGKKALLGMRMPVDGNTIFMVSLQSIVRNCFTSRHIDVLAQLQDIFRALASKLFTQSHRNLVYTSQQARARESSLSQLKQCRGLEDVVERLEMVAPTDSTVLIQGESGVGKELAANSLHQLSPRVRGRLVKVNCAALPETLLESMLFGHEKGSFTGATQAHEGYFEQADGGTLFLDEVGELSAAAQARLLRVLENHSVERVGAVRSIPVDVRLIAATNRDLRRLGTEGSFRRDLWFRLKVFPIEIPPLRRRREDIITLVRFHYHKLVEELKLNNPPVLTSEAESVLCAYSWPGNVRELSHVLQQALIVGCGRHERELKLERDYFELDEPQDCNDGQEILCKGRTAREADRATGERSGGNMLDAGMAGLIWSALDACNGHVHGPAGAAARLGVNPNTLRSRMRRLGIPLPGAWRQGKGEEL